MQLSQSLEQSALNSIIAANDSQDFIENQNKLIPIESTPFYATLSGDGINPHGIVMHEGRKYFVGTIDNQE